MAKTGPQTPQAKARVSLNALRHGLRGGPLVLPGIESETDWRAFRDSMIEDMRPVGPRERVLCERVAEMFWRLARASRADTSALGKAWSEAGVRAARRNRRRRYLPPEPPERFFVPPLRALAAISRHEAHLSRAHGVAGRAAAPPG